MGTEFVANGVAGIMRINLYRSGAALCSRAVVKFRIRQLRQAANVHPSNMIATKMLARGIICFSFGTTVGTWGR